MECEWRWLLGDTCRPLPLPRLLLDSGAGCCLPDSTGRLLSCPGFSGTQFLLETSRRERVQAICEALESAVSLANFQRIWQVRWQRLVVGVVSLASLTSGPVGLQPASRVGGHHPDGGSRAQLQGGSEVSSGGGLTGRPRSADCRGHTQSVARVGDYAEAAVQYTSYIYTVDDSDSGCLCYCRRRTTISPEDSEQTTSDNHGPLTPSTSHRVSNMQEVSP